MEFERLDPDVHGAALPAEADGPGRWLDPRVGRPLPPSEPVARKRGTASSILAAAMIGFVEALGWERPKDETVEVADAPLGDDGLVLDYRDLEPLE